MNTTSTTMITLQSLVLCFFIPVIGFLLGAQFVPPVISTASIVANPSREFFFYQYIDWKVIRYLMLGSLLGAILGAWTFFK